MPSVRPGHTRSSRRGFTLVEVLVALVVMATMAAIAYRGIDAMSRSREIAQAHLARAARLQAVMVQWELDLRALQDGHGSVAPVAFDGGSVVLTRQAHDGTGDGLAVVIWGLREGGLWRWQSPAVRTRQALADQRQQGLQQLAALTPALLAFDGVASWQLHCFRNNAWSNCLSSADEGPRKTDAPPDGLRVIMQLADGGTLTRALEVTVR